MTRRLIETDSSTPSSSSNPWRQVQKIAKTAIAPVERFLAIEASSGILLLLVAAIALLWANSPWLNAYEELWHTPFGIRLGEWSFERDMHFWINDGLMTIFFFVVGLEIRREIHKGELSEPKRAALPLFAALGGMLVPACFFLGMNAGRSSAQGWGIPMATDIAFAVGIIALLGKRISPALRIFLLTLAVIDDIGAILVIALFYSTDLSALGFTVAGFGLATVLVMQKIGIRTYSIYILPAIVAWAGIYVAGIHPTISGVLIGLMTPVRARLQPDGFLNFAHAELQDMKSEETLDEKAIIPHLDSLNAANKEVVSPVERLIHSLHGWVAFGIMPLFALANAGVPLGKASLEGDGFRIFGGIMVGLILGKPIGVMLFSWAAVRLGIAKLPKGVSWKGVGTVGLSAGIGFTMAIFISQLAFPQGQNLETAKLSILSASAAAAILAYAAGKILFSHEPVVGAARTESEAESSSDV